MKATKHFFLLALLLCFAGIQNTTAQSLESQMRSFFSYNDNQAYWWLSKCAHPTNTFKYGTLTMSGDNVYVTVNADGSWSGNYDTKVRLHKNGSRFDYIEVISDTDWAPAFEATNIIKNLVANYLNNNFHDSLSMLESMYGKRLVDMNGKELCAAIITALLWKYPY